jgi:ribosomal protein L10
MNRPAFLLVGFFLFTLALEGACGEKKDPGVTAKEVKKETQKTVETALAYTKQQKEEYQKQLGAKIKEYDRKLEELTGKAKKMEKKTKTEAQKELADLEQKREAVGKKLEEMKSASGKVWEDLKSGMDKAVEDFGKSLDRAFSRFR